MTHRILVVDDERDITALVAYHLAKEGFRVSTAASGPEALKSVADERPDLVVLDLMLPGIGGLLDRTGLERECCECYGVVSREFKRLLG